MAFELQSKQGTVEELDADLVSAPSHEREETVVPVIKAAITDIVNSLGGYLSVSASGNINPVSGENGDIVNIYITSLSPPAAPTPLEKTVPVEVPVVTPPVEEIGTEPVPIAETPIVETAPATEPVVETPPAETPPSEPEAPVAEVPVAETPVTSPEAPVVTEPPAGEAGQEIPQTNEVPTTPVITENPAESPPVSVGTETPVTEHPNELTQPVVVEPAPVTEGVIEPNTPPAETAPVVTGEDVPPINAEEGTSQAA